MTCRRVQEWYDYWEGNVYLSYSGGKDSTVLMDIIKNKCGLTDVPIVFVDTGLEFPEVRKMGRKYANVILRPEMNFKEILKECGYPIISKEVASTVEGANKFLRERERALNIPIAIGDLKDWENIPIRLKKLYGILGRNNQKPLEKIEVALALKDTNICQTQTSLLAVSAAII